MATTIRTAAVLAAAGLAACAGSAATGPGGGTFTVCEDGDVLCLLRDGRPAAVYQLRDRVFPETPQQNRCGYFRELYAPSGRLVTEDGPADHLHHRGLFLTWNRVSWSRDPSKGWEKTANFWELRAESGRRAPAELVEARADGADAVFTVRHDWRIGEQVILKETLDARAGAAAPDVTRLDLDFRLTAVGGAVELSEYAHHPPGSPHFYGTLGLRAAAAFVPERLVFTYSDGKDHNAVEDGRFEGTWVDLTGDLEGGTCGVALAWHPDNPPARLNHWRKLRFLNTDITAMGPLTIAEGRTLRLRFRALIHDGTADGARIAERARW
jgi:hypothetical protein